jgi:hypothetical protein
MDIKCKTCNIGTWKKHLFLRISSTNIYILVPSLYQCIETLSIEVFWLSFQPLQHNCFNLFIISKIFATQLWTALQDKRFPPWTENICVCICFSLSPFAHKKPTTECCSLVVHSSSTDTFGLLKPASEHAHARLLHVLLWISTVLLHSDRKPITSITAVLLPFVNYLLTFPYIYVCVWISAFASCTTYFRWLAWLLEPP